MRKLYAIPGVALLLAACYSPEPFEAEEIESASSQTSEMGTLFPVNGGKQICNPSVSNDMENYPASMLWLNFSGKLNVKPPDSIYTTTRVEQHDRLTVSDTAGNVNWYMMIDKETGECQFQDPEWSTHANYVVALRAYDLDGSKACENLDYGIFAARMSDKKKFWFYTKGIGEFATPHVWVGEDALDRTDSTDAASDSTVEGFFGTKNVRLTYVTKKDEIVFVDFANGGFKKAVTLKKPAGRSSWSIDSPLISPDGNFVVYNMVENSTTWEAYIQELSATSTAVKIEQETGMMSAPAQPHWFAFGGRLFVLWAEFPSGSQMLNKNDLAETSVQDGSVGRTVMREISLAANAPSDLAFEWLGEIRELAPVPLTGGRSPDGKFIATGTNNAYLLELP